MPEKSENEKQTSRLNVVMAFIGLCLGFTNFLPNQSVNYVLETILGRNPFNITVNRLILILMAAVSTTGALWFLKKKRGDTKKAPSFPELLPHLLIPVFSSVTLAYALSQLVRTPWWWLVYLVGLLLLAVVFVAEERELNNYDNLTPVPMISLSALSVGLYLLGLIVLRTIGPRLYVLVPFVGLASAFVATRFVTLRTRQKPAWEAMIIVVLISSQVAAALYYLFINALQFGLIMTGLLYCLVTITSGLQNKKRGASLVVEPITMLVLTAILTGLTFLI